MSETFRVDFRNSAQMRGLKNEPSGRPNLGTKRNDQLNAIFRQNRKRNYKIDPIRENLEMKQPRRITRDGSIPPNKARFSRFTIGKLHGFGLQDLAYTRLSLI